MWVKHQQFYLYFIPVSFASTCPLVSFEEIGSSLSFNFDAVCDCNSVPMLHTSGRGTLRFGAGYNLAPPDLAPCD